jgi:hypothetical protein
LEEIFFMTFMAFMAFMAWPEEAGLFLTRASIAFIMPLSKASRSRSAAASAVT